MLDVFRFLGRTGSARVVRTFEALNVNQASLSQYDVIATDAGAAFYLPTVAFDKGGQTILRRVFAREVNAGTPVKADIDLVFLDDDAGAAPTIPTANAPFTLADFGLVRGVYTISTGQWKQLGSANTQQYFDGNGLGVALQAQTNGRGLFVVPIVNTGTPTYAATDDLYFSLTFESQ